MSGGNDSPPPPPPPKLPPPPKPQEILDYIDRVSGVEMVTVTDSKGKKQRVLQKIPRTQQEEAHYKMGEQMLIDSLKAIPELMKFNPKDVVKFEPFINVIAELNQDRMRDLQGIPGLETIQEDVQSFRNVQQGILENNIGRERSRLDTELSLQGRSRGSYAAAQRAALDAEARTGREQSELMAREYGRNLRERQLNEYGKEFNLREIGRQQKLGGAQLEYQLKKQQLSDLEGKRQQALNERYKQFQIGAGLRGEDVNKAMMSRAPELALQQQNMMTAQDLNAYSQDISRQNQNYQNQLGHYITTEQMRQPSFGEWLGDTAGNLAITGIGAYLGGPGGGMMAQNMFSGAQGNNTAEPWLRQQVNRGR